MMPASKHGDPQLGVDIHLCVVPPSPSPVPLPTPHMSVVFDPFDYVPIIGATISVCGMKRATAGTSGIAVHIPPGFPFAPMLPQKDDELFMGSATVVADGDPFSYIALPVLSCQIAGMPSIPRPRKKGPKKMMLGPLVFNLAIPTNVFVGGPPTISLMGLAMKGAFAGLGKLAKSGVFKRMRQKLFKNMNPGFLKCTILRAEPVNILNGAVSVEHQDFVLPGRIPIEWRRVYGSDSEYAGQCGFGWETPADGRLEINQDGVLMRYPGVGPLYFDGVPVAEGDAAAELELQDGAVLTDVDGEYRVRTKEDRIYHFPKNWLRPARRGGSTIALGKVSDLCGNWLKFERSSGALTGIQESAGRQLEFLTDHGRILEIALVLPESAERHVYARYEYDQHGDLLSVRDALNHPYTFGYDAHYMVRHTDRNGLSFYYEYDASPNERHVVHAWGDDGLYDYRFAYSDVLKERRITDSLGNVSVVKLNEQGLPINEIDALGGVTIYEYDAAGRTIAVVDQDGHRTAYEYDGHGNLLKLLRPDGSAIQTLFNQANKAVSITDPCGAEWQQTWDERGLLLEQMTPLRHVSRYQYDALGQLSSFVNPRGARTNFKFDPYGNLSHLTDALGRLTRFGYDTRGNLIAKSDALGRSTSFRYDAAGRLMRVGLSAGTQIRCAYDREGNLTEYADEAGACTSFEYFGQGEIAKRTQPDGHSLRYTYDTEERLIAVHNQRGECYRLNRDSLGRIVEEVDYWGQSHRYEYSLGGELRQVIDPLGSVVALITDPLGRVVKKTLPHPNQPGKQLTETFTYDGNDHVLAADNSAIRIERRFDAEGNLLEERQGESFTVRGRYDENGNRIERHTELALPSGTVRHVVRYAFDANNLVREIAIDEDAPIRIERNAVDEIISEQLSPTLTRELEYHADGSLLRNRVRHRGSDINDTLYTHDAVGNLTERRDSRLGVDRFIYDPVGVISHHLDPQQHLIAYLNDPAGDRLATRIQTDGDRSATAEAAWTREGEYQDAYYRFDRSGNLIFRKDTRGELQLEWNAHQRLTASRIGGRCTRYEYDAFGRRIESRTTGSATLFQWDGDVLLGDACLTDGTAPRLREWVHYPESHVPVAVVAEGRVSYLHNDPNGCPVQIMSADGAIEWAARYSVWGEAEVSQHGVANPIRLQGQYCDADTGLHYNRHRYYDPHIGQFISRDPIGLLGSSNVYQFAPNTLAWADPLGLKCKVIVLGEGMGRIKAAAKHLDAKWYQAWGKNFKPGAFDMNAALKRNERWLKQKMKEGYTIVDIGIDPSRASRSPFYALEQSIIRKAGYPLTVLPWP